MPIGRHPDAELRHAAGRRDRLADRQDDRQRRRPDLEVGLEHAGRRRRRRAARGAPALAKSTGSALTVVAPLDLADAPHGRFAPRVGGQAVEGLGRQGDDAPLCRGAPAAGRSPRARAIRSSIEMRRMIGTRLPPDVLRVERPRREPDRPVPRTTQRPSEKSVRATPSTSAESSCADRRTGPTRASRALERVEVGALAAARSDLNGTPAAELHDLRGALPFERREPRARADRAGRRRPRRLEEPPGRRAPPPRPPRARRRGSAPRPTASRSASVIAAAATSGGSVGTTPTVSQVGPSPAGGSASR